MRVIGRLLETALVVTYMFGMWAARRRGAKHARGAHARRILVWTPAPGRDTFASAYVGTTGWDGYVVPPAPHAAPSRKRIRRHRRPERIEEPQRQARRRLSRVSPKRRRP